VPIAPAPYSNTRAQVGKSLTHVRVTG
jgi:hypothetical protein